MPQFSKRDLSLLIVEDEDSVARYLATTMKSLFKTIECVPTLKAGKDRLAANHIDALLLDLNLTNSMGLAPVKAIRKEYPYLPIIVMTGGDTTADEAMAYGACDFLHKTDMSPHQVFNAIVMSVARRETFRKMSELAAATQPLVEAIEEGKKLQESRTGDKL